MAVGEGHYFLCGVEGAATLLPEFKLPLGAPKGPNLGAGMVNTGGDTSKITGVSPKKRIGLTRVFSSGTKSSWIPGANSTARGAGCVEWATGEVTGVCPG